MKKIESGTELQIQKLIKDRNMLWKHNVNLLVTTDNLERTVRKCTHLTIFFGSISLNSESYLLSYARTYNPVGKSASILCSRRTARRNSAPPIEQSFIHLCVAHTGTI